MATIYQLRTFDDIVTAIREELKIGSGDTTSINRIKRNINLAYADVASRNNWEWLNGTINLQTRPYISSGTVSITENSRTITFSSAPAKSQEGAYITFNGENQIHEIYSHTAGATTAYLRNEFTGSTSATATYKMFRRGMVLPSDVKDVTHIYHDYFSEDVEILNKRDFHRYIANNPYREGRPQYAYISEEKDPTAYTSISGLPALSTRASAGLVKTLVFASDVSSYFQVGQRIKVTSAEEDTYDGEVVVSSVSTTTITYTGHDRFTETATADSSLTVETFDTKKASEKYREVYFYPQLDNEETVVHVDYTRHVIPLENDADESLIPFEDRLVLFYGGLARSWSRERNPEESERSLRDFEAQIRRMLGRAPGSKENAEMRVSKGYMAQKRSRGRLLQSLRTVGTSGGGSGSGDPTGTANRVAIFNSSGVLVASTAISDTELDYLDGITSGVVALTDTQTVTNKTFTSCTIDADNNTISNLAHGAEVDNPTSGVHGVTGSVVGTTDAQTITNKTIDADNNTVSNLAHGAEVDNPSSGVHGVTGSVVGTSDAQTLTNKSIDSDNNTITNIVNADIKAAAAIALDKLAAVTASRVLESDGSGFVTASAITATELSYLNDVVPLTTVALSDNQASAADIFTYSASSFESSVIEYSISRGSGNREVGQLMVATDGTSVNLSRTASTLGTIGVTITADINAGNVRIRYTSTSTGTAPTFNYIQRRWT